MNDKEIENKINSLTIKSNNLQQRVKWCEGAIEKIQDLTISVNNLANSVSTMAKNQESLNARLAAIEKEPLENMKNFKKVFITTLITAITSGVVGYLLGILFK